MHVFIDWGEVTLGEPLKSEVERLNNAGVELGEMLQYVDDIKSNHGTQGSRYLFENGEIIIHDGTVYALYGPIFEYVEHLREQDRAPYEELGFPVSPIENVEGTGGQEGQKMEFEGVKGDNPTTAVYASSAGVGHVEKDGSELSSIHTGDMKAG